VALYESMGFKQFGLEPIAILTPGGFRAKRHMWLQLAVHQNAVELFVQPERQRQ
jgi:uncharacterized cupin superfamily protein